MIHVASCFLILFTNYGENNGRSVPVINIKKFMASSNEKGNRVN